MQSYNQNRITFVSSNEGQSGHTILTENLKDKQGNVDPALVNYLKQKVEITKDCHHPNILKYKDNYIQDNKFIILMSECSTSLYIRIQELYYLAGININIFLDYALQILDAVEYLHSKNLFLQNFNNKNILLDNDLNIQLIDYNFKQTVNTLKANQQFVIGDRQKPYHYYAPEQIHNSKESEVEQTIEGDIWSVGISLYLLAGSNLDQLYMLTKGFEKYKTQEQVSYEINLILEQMLRQDPKERPQIKQIKKELKEIQKNLAIENQQEKFQDEEEINLFIKAQILFEKRKNKQSLELLEKLIEKNSKNDMFYAWRARNLATLNELVQSQQSADQALQINPSNYLACNVKGYFYYLTHEYAKSEQYLRTTIDLKPSFLIAAQNLCGNYQALNLIEKAIQMFEQLNNLMPNKIQILHNLSCSYFQLKDFTKSKYYLSKLLSLYPDNYYAIFYMGQICKEHQQNNKSKLFYKKITNSELRKDNPYTLNLIATIYYDQKKYEKSLKKYKKCHKQDSNQHSYLYNLTFMKTKV